MTNWDKSERGNRVVYSKRSGPQVREVVEIRNVNSDHDLMFDGVRIPYDLYPELVRLLLSQMSEEDRRDVLLSAGFREARD